MTKIQAAHDAIPALFPCAVDIVDGMAPRSMWLPVNPEHERVIDDLIREAK